MDAEPPLPAEAAAPPLPLSSQALRRPPPPRRRTVDGKCLQALALSSGHGAPIVDETRAGAKSPPPSLGRAGQMPCVVVRVPTLEALVRQGLVRRISGTQAWEPSPLGLEALRSAPSGAKGGRGGKSFGGSSHREPARP